MKKQHKPHVKDPQTAGFLTPLLSRGQYKKEIKQRTRYEFNPLDRAIQGDLAGSQSRQAEIPAWFKQYQDAVSGAANRTNAAYQQANQNFTQQAQQAGQQDTASRQDMQQRASQDANLRGVPVDYQGAQAALEAANARNNLQASFAGTVGTIGANQQGYLADKGRIGVGEMINQIQKEQTRERGIRSDMRALAQKKGDYASQLGSELRESDRKYQLSKQSMKGMNSRAALSANTSTANNIRSTSTSAANSRRSSATSRRGQDISHADRQASLRQQIARIKEARNHNDITEAQAQQRIQIAKKKAKSKGKK